VSHTADMDGGNLFANLPAASSHEVSERIVEKRGVVIERIVSLGQATPGGEWFDGDRDEWVVLLTGGAGVRIDGESAPRTLTPGDYLYLPARLRHRVEWTDPRRATVWLAVHLQP